MRSLAAALLLAVAAPAAADAYRWTDAAGEEHFTDDPASVPAERRHTLRNLDDAADDEEGGTFSSTDEPAADGVDQRERTLALEARRRLADEHAAAVAALEKERAALSEARRESRKWKAGGRIGAADRAAEADKQVAALERQVRALEARVAGLEARLATP